MDLDDCSILNFCDGPLVSGVGVIETFAGQRLLEIVRVLVGMARFSPAAWDFDSARSSVMLPSVMRSPFATEIFFT